MPQLGTDRGWLIPNVKSDPSTPLAAIRRAGLLSFVALMYSYATAGPFGLEDQVTTSGPGMTLLFHLLIPFFLSIPVSLVAAELTTAIPVEGGFYRWVRIGYGNFWGFLAGWWNWCSSFVLGGVYAVLFSDYLRFFFPSMQMWEHYAVSLLLIALMAWINITGIQMAGAVATVLESFILLPVAVLCVMAATKWHHNPFIPLVPPHVPTFQVFGVGLALGLWLYAGYEQMSSVAGEVDNPQRNYPIALAIVIPISIATYFLPTLFSLAALGNWQDWKTGYFSEAARLIGGPWLGFWMTVAAAVTNISLLNATMLTGTRMPSAMAEDGYFPSSLTKKHSRYGTPWIAILLSSAIYALLAVLNLGQLIKAYAWLRIAVTVLTVVSAWRIRQIQPQLARPFRIPGGRAGLFYVVAAPVAMSVVALLGSDRFSLLWGPVALALGPLAYGLLRALRAGRPQVNQSSSL